MGVACVTTPISHEPVGARADAEIRVGDSPDSLAVHIMDLLAHDAERERLAEAGRNYVTTTYAMERTRTVLNDVFARALMRGRGQ